MARVRANPNPVVFPNPNSNPSVSPNINASKTRSDAHQDFWSTSVCLKGTKLRSWSYLHLTVMPWQMCSKPLQFG